MRVLVPVSTLLGLGNQDGHLPGYGANTYAPSARMREYIEARDQHCGLPGCRRSAHHSEIDHTIEFGLPGGLTVRINLSALRRKHHKLEHLKGWDLVQDEEGCLIFVTPTGQQYRTIPPTPLGEETPPERLTPLPDPSFRVRSAQSRAH